MYTVTIDANDGKLGTVTTRSIEDGKTVAALTGDELPTKTDSEILYWSTVKDDASALFEFDKTIVSKDITIYPHFRVTFDKLIKYLSGSWLDTNENTIGGVSYKNKFIYKISANNNLNAICFAREGGSAGAGIDLGIASNSNILKALINLPVTDPAVDPVGETKSTQTIDTRTIFLSCQYYDPIALDGYADTKTNTINIKDARFFGYSGAQQIIDFNATSIVFELHSTSTTATNKVTIKRVN